VQNRGINSWGRGGKPALICTPAPLVEILAAHDSILSPSGKFRGLFDPRHDGMLMCMSKLHTHKNKGEGSEFGKEIVELLLEPLSALVDQARLQILEKILEVENSIEILARQTKRDLEK
jgi:hypothetical protein